MLVLPVCRWLRPICRSRLTSRGAWELAAPGSWAPRLSSAMKKRSFSHSLMHESVLLAPGCYMVYTTTNYDVSIEINLIWVVRFSQTSTRGGYQF